MPNLKTKYEEWVAKCREYGIAEVTIGLLQRIAEKDPLQSWTDFSDEVKRVPSYIRKVRTLYGDLINDYAQQFLFRTEMPAWFDALNTKCRAGDVSALRLAFELERKIKEENHADVNIIIEHSIPRPDDTDK